MVSIVEFRKVIIINFLIQIEGKGHSRPFQSPKSGGLSCFPWPSHNLCNIRRIILETWTKSVPLNVCLLPTRTPPLLICSEWSVIGSGGREETQFLRSLGVLFDAAGHHCHRVGQKHIRRASDQPQLFGSALKVTEFKGFSFA